MTKQEFLNRIRRGISHLDKTDIERYSEFYSEMIDDRIEEGLSEEVAVNALGSPKCIVEDILENYKNTDKNLNLIKRIKKLKPISVTLIIIGSPIWLSLLLVALAVVFSVYISLWSVIVALYAAVASIFAGSLCGIACFVFFIIFGKIPQSLMFLSAGFVLLGLFVPMLFAVNFLAKYLCKLTKFIIIKTVNFFKGEKINEEI